MFRNQCLCCGSSELLEIVNLGMHPMADTFVPADKLDVADRVYPLICDLCPSCKQIQLRTITDPDERYVDVDYSYTSSNSQTSRAHWQEYAQHTSRVCHLPKGSTVVEIGSNDGYLLEQYSALGFRSVGIEPSPVMASMAQARGMHTELGYFSLAKAVELVEKLDLKPKLIVANNVFNHSNDPLDFAKGISTLLDRSGVFVFELPYWLASIEQGKFDQIYHEHVSYFTVLYARNLFEAVGMHVIDVEEVDYHGGSIRVYVSHDASIKKPAVIESFVERESKAGLFCLDTYKDFSKNIEDHKNAFLKHLYSLRSKGKKVICVGAAAKGNTFLNYYKLDQFSIDFVTDASLSKIGKFTPLSRIPIQDDAAISKYEEVFIIILSWNLEAVLKKKLAEINPNINLLNPFSS
ncbi:class I SAM-dependent methyltransferase [Rhodoferax aquaticus]|uniref:Class I SAM-dependent methyltransferase n=1 Tax=Rhodoferax aquaticus TaxID=2527691 RepID=A0A515ETY4_9BURK|nr:class I SAM-dependent methyltransferase [Rhodoferax aquaticus]QDL56078.1 class I SAM-dependent methyltransferase [Rhodoferax aquaticus]